MANPAIRAADLESFRLRRRADPGQLEWIELTADGEIRYRKEPKTSFFKRLLVRIFGWLPIEPLL